MYAYQDLIYDLIRIDVFQPWMSFFSLGYSVLGQNLFCVKAGTGEKKMLVVAGHHSLETIMSEVLMEYLFRLKQETLTNLTLYAVPLLNPDGAEIVAGRIHEERFAAEKDCWQANYRGVDLNHNYDAGFQLAKKEVEAEGIFSAHHTKYGGESPFSEPESRAIFDLCQKIPFDVAVALHTQGEEIYYEYDGIVPKGTEEFLKKISSVSHYRIAKPTGTASHGGMKDWFIKTYQKPAFTIEAGHGKNPLPHTLFPRLYRDTAAILDAVAEALREHNDSF